MCIGHWSLKRPVRWLREELFAEGGLGEVAADACGGTGLIEEDVGGTDAEAALEGVDELFETVELGGGGDAVIEVADQADADAVGIDAGGTAGDAGGGLVVPARADLHFAVDASIAVTDDEMIGDAGGSLDEAQCVAGGGGAVVDVDVFPSAGPHGGVGLEDYVHCLGRFDGEEAIGCVGSQWGGRQGEEKRAGERENKDEAGEHDNATMGFFHGNTPLF